ncbi:hypothetical protein VTN96DRAFT_4410 [Rasamsonia emersonii]
MEDFVTKLEQFLGIQRSIVSLEDMWAKKNPADSRETLEDYLQNTFMTILWKGYYESLTPFRKDYEKKFGYSPYVHPTVRYCCKRGSQISNEELAVASERKRIYSSWLRGTILGESFNTIMVYPVGDPKPFYRDEYRKSPEHSSGYRWNEREDHQASLAGVPAVVVPVGQAPFPSKITGESQLLPVHVSLMSGPNTDHALVTLLRDFLHASYLPAKVCTGKLAFHE